MGCPPAQIAKTLSCLLPDGPLLLLTAGDTRIDNGKYKARFHTKAKMLPPRRWNLSSATAWAEYVPLGCQRGSRSIWMRA